MVVSDVLKRAKIKLAHMHNSGLDAAVLLAHVLSVANWKQLSLMGDVDVSAEHIMEFDKLVARREKQEPVALIVGRKEFWSLDFRVTHDTLLPRPETELIIELVLRHFPEDGYNILDLGTGSGCLIITLLHNYKNSCGVGVDISAEALEVAHGNGVLHGVANRVNFIRSNWLESIPSQKFDIVVANPPYIRLEDMPNLQPNVVNFEPHRALTDFADGLEHYRTILASMHSYIHDKTLCFIEFGINQGDDIAKLLVAYGYKLVERKKDLAEIERCMVFGVR